MSSGIAINPKVSSIFKEINARKVFAMIVRVSDDSSELIVEKTFDNSDLDPETKWNNVKSYVPETDCRFVIADFQWKVSAASVSSKISLFHWAPENAPIKPRMLYATSKEKLVNSFSQDVRSVQINDKDDFEYLEVKNKVAK